jgi:peptide deformylase
MNTMLIALDDPRLRAENIPLSRQVCRSKRTMLLAQHMFARMKLHNGVGLAAPQIGVNWQMVIVQTVKRDPDDPKSTDKFATLLNPEIMESGEDEQELEEGCLSLSGDRYFVKRPRAVVVEARATDGKPYTWRVEDPEGEVGLARIVQHELDHLRGVLISDIGALIRNENAKIATLAP